MAPHLTTTRLLSRSPTELSSLPGPRLAACRLRRDSRIGGAYQFYVRRRNAGARCSASYKSPVPLPDFYDLLGVSVEADAAEIRRAYRMLQKKHHPDLVGQQGHAMALLLNEAYQTLMDENLRAAYNTAHSYRVAIRKAGHKAFTGNTYSSWVGPDRPQGLFVDENACVGCRKCVFAASNTFIMDESTGCARVQAQWADSESNITMAREVCPVNCIHLVEREDLPILEYLIRPQAKPSNGVYGGGWERTSNVFMAARTFKRQQEEQRSQTAPSSTMETPAQKKARVEADRKLRMGVFWRFWSWVDPSPRDSSASDFAPEGSVDTEWPWKGLFGRSSSLDVLVLPVSQENKAQTVALIQDWALTYASSSELPLPMPFKADLLYNGVQLSLITASNGTVSSIGSLVVTVEDTVANDDNAPGNRSDELAEGSTVIQSFLKVRRQATTGTSSLPGEGRIVKEIKATILGMGRGGDSYEAYQLRR
ncbi:ferredoxin [Marchantia polymorpha subsp. ruderalis]|uniref:J domain-containing protein n=2 Tax=Marchantia polymorpha TaxID=3197 RepID=A0AAF6AYV6_MARPO|nr:hypothetical protein MARPO_0105s0023 [Marchantia polymorpha]BBN04940.1 hypothetical protein Mp_3g08940 [Marchantia polymorpha subsp. ruderalis]|eukprot:PTQ31904.1 hypothetical protein MARPO_0105s0023 [Marchantia polymorpha]